MTKARKPSLARGQALALRAAPPTIPAAIHHLVDNVIRALLSMIFCTSRISNMAVSTSGSAATLLKLHPQSADAWRLLCKFDRSLPFCGAGNDAYLVRAFLFDG